MSYSTLYENWPLTRQALARAFPEFSFPNSKPPIDTFEDALVGLAAAHHLTMHELRETISDFMLMIDPAEAEKSDRAA